MRHVLTAMCCVVVWLSGIGEVAAVSLDEQALINVLRGHNPQKADEIERRLNEIDKSDMTPEQKLEARNKFLDREEDQAMQDIELAKRLGSKESLRTAAIVVELTRKLNLDSQDQGQPWSKQFRFQMHHDVEVVVNKERTRLQKERAEKEQKAREANEAKPAPGKQTSMAQPGMLNQTYVSVAPAVLFGTWRGPRPTYLGFENAALVQRFRVEDLETDDSFTGADLHLTAALGRGLAVHIGVNGYDLKFRGARETIDPLGEDLLFPGVTSAGFALGAGVPEGTPGGFNVVEGLRYSYDADSTTIYAALSRSYDCAPFNLIGYGGIGYTSADQRQRLEGLIPGFGPDFDFSYDTRFGTETTRGILGGRVTAAPIPKYEQLRLNAGFTAFLNYVDVDGSDALNLDGTLEQLDVGQDEFTFGWAAGIGAEWDVGAVTLFANYRYVDDDTVPIAVREDAGPSHAEIERAQAHTGMLGARLTF